MAEAARLAESAGDRAGLLAAAALAQRLGRRAFQQSDLAAAQAGLLQSQAGLSLKLNPFTDADFLAQQQAHYL